MTQLVQENKITLVHNLLSFYLDGEIFAVSVNKVIEIMEVPQISKLPRAQPYMMGVINVRGTVLPLIDTRAKMGMSPITFGKNTCAIIIEIEKALQIVHLGILVDSVLEVMEVIDDEIQPTPNMENEIYADFIKGIVARDKAFVLMLDLDGFFSKEDIRHIKIAGENELTSLEINEISETTEVNQVKIIDKNKTKTSDIEKPLKKASTKKKINKIT